MGLREHNRTVKRQAIVDAGLEQLLRHSLDGLRALLNASALSGATGISKDTAYRLFRDEEGSSDEVVREVATASTRPEWSGFEQANDDISAAFEDALGRELPFGEVLIETMAANAAAQFRSLGGPTGWFLQSAAMTASPAWEGGAPLSPEDEKLGREILAIRAQFYQRLTDDLVGMLHAAMSLTGRRPRHDLSPRQIVAVLHSMIDGAVLRRYVEPDVFDNRVIGEAMLALAMAFTEDGTVGDPRCPSSASGQAMYDALVDHASTRWETATSRSIESTASDAGVGLDAARLIFPSSADLADSVLWRRVLSGGSMVVARGGAPDGLAEHVDQASRPQFSMVFGILRRLCDVVDDLPGAADVARCQPPSVGPGVRHQLEREVAETIRPQVPAIDPVVTAAELVQAGFTGHDGWPVILTMMRVLTTTGP